MSRFVLSPAAAADVEGIAEFLDARAPRATGPVLRGLRDGMRRIAARPGIGRLRRDLSDEPLRFYVVWSWLVIYRSTDPVEVVRVLHGARDVARILGKRRRR